MKQCPSCRTTYTDETLRFCLADGSVLSALDGDQPTVVRTSGIGGAEETVAFGRDPAARVEIPVANRRTNADQAPMPANVSPGTSGPASGLILKILLALIGLFVLALLVVGLAGGVFYFNSGKADPPGNAANVKSQAPPTPAKDDRDELRDQIANLEKRLDEQKRSGQTANVPLKLPNRSTTTASARVDSPGDGFLALRSLPSSEMGDRILKIPHGAIVAIGACGPVITPVKRRGRWCQASYNGYDGWVFDAYLVY